MRCLSKIHFEQNQGVFSIQTVTVGKCLNKTWITFPAECNILSRQEAFLRLHSRVVDREHNPCSKLRLGEMIRCIYSMLFHFFGDIKHLTQHD